MKKCAKIYGIRNCGSVQKALKFLELANVRYDFIDFKLNPPSQADITRWCEIFGIESLLNSKGMTYKKLGLGKQNLSLEDKLKQIEQHPTLIKRPIIEIYETLDTKQPKEFLIGFDEAKYKATFGDS